MSAVRLWAAYECCSYPFKLVPIPVYHPIGESDSASSSEEEEEEELSEEQMAIEDMEFAVRSHDKRFEEHFEKWYVSEAGISEVSASKFSQLERAQG